MEHARLFRQQVISDVELTESGVLNLVESSGNRIAIGKDDTAILCTGQRADQTIVEFCQLLLSNPQEGIFVALPFSIQACTSALYTTKLVLDYMERRENQRYKTNKIQKCLAMVAKQTCHPKFKVSGVWSSIMVFSSGIQLYLPSIILPNVRGDLAVSFFWNTPEVYGKSLNVRETLEKLSLPSAPIWGPLLIMAAASISFCAYFRPSILGIEINSAWYRKNS